MDKDNMDKDNIDKDGFVAQLTISKGGQYIKKFKIKADDSVLTIGRHNSNDIILSEDNNKTPSVSRVHAAIIRLDLPGKDTKSSNNGTISFFIRDLGSASGTRIENERGKEKSYLHKKQLENGDKIHISGYVLEFRKKTFPEDSEQQHPLNELYKTLPYGANSNQPTYIGKKGHKAQEKFRQDLAKIKNKAQQEFLQYFSKFDVASDILENHGGFINSLLTLLKAEKAIIGLYKNGKVDIKSHLGFERDDPPYCGEDFIQCLWQEGTIRQEGALWVKLNGSEKKNDFIALFRTMPPSFSDDDEQFMRCVGEYVEISRSTTEELNELTPWRSCMVGLFDLREKCLQIARAKSGDILILGENGVGKEALAQFIHEHSPRREGPFISVNCALMPTDPALAHIEFFGHKKGAFTLALSDKEGYFQMAQGGTLFLDEIGDMPQHIQALLLTAIQQRKIIRLGGDKEESLDVRILAATDQDLKSKMKKDTFRQALYERFTYEISVPSLRERRHEIPLLAHYFLDKYSKDTRSISRQALDCLRNYDWPGNIRELQKAIEQALLSEKETIFSWDLPPEIRCAKKLDHDHLPALGDIIAVIEKAYIMWVLTGTKGNREKALEILKIARETLFRRLREYNNDSIDEELYSRLTLFFQEIACLSELLHMKPLF